MLVTFLDGPHVSWSWSDNYLASLIALAAGAMVGRLIRCAMIHRDYAANVHSMLCLEKRIGSCPCERTAAPAQESKSDHSDCPGLSGKAVDGPSSGSPDSARDADAVPRMFVNAGPPVLVRTLVAYRLGTITNSRIAFSDVVDDERQVLRKAVLVRWRVLRIQEDCVLVLTDRNLSNDTEASRRTFLIFEMHPHLHETIQTNLRSTTLARSCASNAAQSGLARTRQTQR